MEGWSSSLYNYCAVALPGRPVSHRQLSSWPSTPELSSTRMANIWEREDLNMFFSHYEEDYHHEAQEAVLEQEEEGFVCLSPDSGSESETFIDDEYDICADAIEEIENLKKEEELFANKEYKQEADADDGGNQDQLATFKVPENKAATLAAKRRRPEVDESSLGRSTSTPSPTPQPSTKKQKLLGEGSFGKVYKMEEDGQVFAVKELSALEPKAKREQDMLESVKHKHIIKYIRTFTADDRLNIVMEYADRGSLLEVVHTAVRDPKMLHLFDEQNIWRFLNQMSSALDYLHSHKPKKILHRDLKVTLKLSASHNYNSALFQPHNILIVSSSNSTPGFQFKLADFGLAKLLTADAKGEHYASTRCGTPRYMAPEVTSNWRKYSFGADIFSLGCILAFYANQGKHLFYSQDEINNWQGVMDEKNNEVMEPGRHSADLVEIVGQMLRVEQKERPSAKEILQQCTKTRMMVKPRISYCDPEDPDVFESLQHVV